MDIKEIEALVEGLLFSAGDPLPLEKIAEIVELDKKATRLILSNMIVSVQNSKRGIILRELDGCYQLCSRPEHYEYIRKLVEPRQKQALSQAAYETLSIIAYNQPVTRARVEMIRGVNSDSAITRLIERNLIREAGRMDAPGKPFIYETTEEFLRSFGFRSIKDLPIIEFGDMLPDEEQRGAEDGRQNAAEPGRELEQMQKEPTLQVQQVQAVQGQKDEPELEQQEQTEQE
jgi:segregation and condensation protein B